MKIYVPYQLSLGTCVACRTEKSVSSVQSVVKNMYSVVLEKR